MLDIKWIVSNQEEFLASMKARNYNVDLNSILKIYNLIRSNNLRIENNDSEKKQLIKDNKELQINLRNFLENLPNILQKDVKFGHNESDNVVIKTWGNPRKFDFEPLSHDILGEKNSWLDFKTAAKISGARFVILKHDAVKLERKLSQFMLEHIENFWKKTGKFYEEVSVPLLTSENSMWVSGQLPKFADEAFRTIDGRYLIPTSETILCNLHFDEILKDVELPKIYASYSQCFRSEAGSRSKDTKGMIRQHQFSKVEMFAITNADESYQIHEKMLECACLILEKLNLPYRVVVLCSGDIGFASSKTYDIEVWLPSQNCYREICSCSNTLDFQSRRGNIRVKRNDKNEFVHMLNSSALAVGRTIVALMENYQTKDGKIELPECLR